MHLTPHRTPSHNQTNIKHSQAYRSIPEFFLRSLETLHFSYPKKSLFSSHATTCTLQDSRLIIARQLRRSPYYEMVHPCNWQQCAGDSSLSRCFINQLGSEVSARASIPLALVPGRAFCRDPRVSIHLNLDWRLRS